MSQTATIIIAIITGTIFLYSLISSTIEQLKFYKDPNPIITTGDGKYAVKNKEGELVEIDLNQSDAPEQLLRFLVTIEENLKILQKN